MPAENPTTTRILWGIDLFDSNTFELIPSHDFLLQLVSRLRSGNSGRAVEIFPTLIFNTNQDRPNELAGLLRQKAEDLGADLIVVTSHSRSGLGLWTRGSVSEALSVTSDIPVMIIGKNFRPIHESQSHSVLFATDLSAKSYKALRRLGPLLRQLRAQLHLYHALTLESTLHSNALGYVAIGSDPSGLAASSASDPWHCMRELETLRNEMIQEGIPCTYELDPKEGSIVERIIQAARRNQAAWIAAPGLSSKHETRIWGSLSQELARESPVPTWIMHT